MLSDWLVFCDCGFHSVCPLMEEDKRLMEASLWERLTEGGNWVLFWWVGPCSVSLFLLKTHRAVFLACCLTWGQTIVEVMKIMVMSFRRSHAGTAAFSAPNPAAGYCWPMPPLETPGHPRTRNNTSQICTVLYRKQPSLNVLDALPLRSWWQKFLDLPPPRVALLVKATIPN